MEKGTSRFAALGVLVGLAACSSNSAGSGGSDGGIDRIPSGCSTDPRAMTYMSNLTVPGESGADGGPSVFAFVLQSRPAPPTQGLNTWTIKVLDASGHPVNGAMLSLPTTGPCALRAGTCPPSNPIMPDHCHGTSLLPQLMANGNGTYTVSNLDLFMAGIWQVKFEAQAGTLTDCATFSFCIGG